MSTVVSLPQRLAARLLALSFVFALAACGTDPIPKVVIPNDPKTEDPDDDQHDHPHLYPRLLIADHTDPSIKVLDLESDEIIETLTTKGPVRAVYAAATGRFGFAVQQSQNLTQIIDAGIWHVDHDDHEHFYEETPVLLAYEIAGQKPSDFAANGNQIGIFNDDDGSADIYSVSELTKAAPAGRTHQAEFAHHGIAVPMGDFTVISKAEDGGSRVAVEVRSADDTIVDTFEPCDSLHGWAARGDQVFIGCDDGVFAITKSGTNFTGKKVSGIRIGTLAAHPDQKYLIGDFRPDRNGITRIDVSDDVTGDAIISLTLGESRVRAFAIEPEHGKEVFVLTDDGSVHVVDIADWEVEQTLEDVISSLDASPYGAMVVGDHVVFVADPSKGEIVELHFEAHKLEIEVVHQVGGTPHSIALIVPGAE